MKLKLVTLMVCLASMTLWAQTVNYPTERIDGYLVYKYPVEKSIGIYRICKNFNVTEEELVRFNPQLNERGPQVDEVLYIPVAGVPREVTKLEQDSDTFA